MEANLLCLFWETHLSRKERKKGVTEKEEKDKCRINE